MTDLNPVPNRLYRPDTLEDDADLFFAKLPQFGADLIALQANMNTVAAGGAYAIPYIFNSAYAGNHNGGHILIVGPAAQNTATSMALDGKDTAGVDWSTLFFGLSGGTSANKCDIRIVKVGDPSKFLTFRVTSISHYGTYGDWQLVNSGGSSPSPFANGDPVLVYFQRAGEKGDPGAYPTLQLPIVHVRHEVANGAGGGLAGTASTYIARQLNTVKKNTVPGASLSGGVLTLPAGTYRIRGFALSGQAGGHAARINAGGTFWTGSSACNASGTTGTNTASFVTAIDVSLGSATSVTLEHRLGQSLNSIDFGQPASAGTNEVYAELIAEKVA